MLAIIEAKVSSGEPPDSIWEAHLNIDTAAVAARELSPYATVTENENVSAGLKERALNVLKLGLRPFRN